MKDIERFAGVRLGPGTLYKAIARLESTGLIEALDPEERRRPYELTPAGEEVLARSVEYLGGVVDEGRRRLGLQTPAVPPGLSGVAGVVGA